MIIVAGFECDCAPSPRQQLMMHQRTTKQFFPRTDTVYLPAKEPVTFLNYCLANGHSDIQNFVKIYQGLAAYRRKDYQP